MRRVDSRFAEVFPEILLLDSKDARWEAARHAHKGAFLSWRILASWIVAWAVGFVLGGVADRAGWLPGWLNPGGIAGGFAGAAVAWSVGVLRRAYLARRLRAYLIDHGVPVCMKCGYSLRGLDSPRCPECGKPFDEAAP